MHTNQSALIFLPVGKPPTLNGDKVEVCCNFFFLRGGEVEDLSTTNLFVPGQRKLDSKQGLNLLVGIVSKVRRIF